MYNISQFKKFSIIFAVIGVVLFGIGWATNSSSHEKIEEHTKQEIAEHGEIVPQHSAHLDDAKDHQAHVEHSEVQIHNKPWAALLFVGMLFFGLSAASLFFLAIQHASQAGWPIVVTRIMEGIASFIPYGALFLLVVVLGAAFGGNHLYHWMDPELVERGGEHYDILIDSKSPFLNIPFWLIRIAIYFGGCIFFMFKLKGLSKKLDETKDVKVYHQLYNWSVGYIAFFALASAAWAWDFLMSIDPHWYSTLYIWYTMVSCLVSGIAFMLIFSIYMKSQGRLPLFNLDHQHDLTKYLFGFSMLWTYLWFAQYLLIWYPNIPEETIYFLGRYELYYNSYFWMLIPNFLMPLLILISSSIKRNAKVVIPMTFVVIFGHLWDYFNIVMPGTVGGYWSIGLLEFGSVFMISGTFFFVVLSALDKLNMEPKGNPFFHESEIYEYPF